VTASDETGRGRNIVIKTDDEIQLMREANQIVAETLNMLENVVEAGITTWDLDKLAEDLCYS
jgi:methionyl aminopeptidase